MILANRKLVTGPPLEPVSVAEAKLHLRETAGDQDAVLTRLIKAARLKVEKFTQRHLIEQTWDLRYPCFPAGQRDYLHRSDEFRLDRAPVKAWNVSGGTPPNHVKYLDGDGVQQTLVYQTDYVFADGEPSVLFPVEGKSWPATYPQLNATGQWPVELRAIFGYGTAGNAVPASSLQAMHLLIAAWYEHREEVSEVALEELPMAVAAQALLWDELFIPW